ncbi:hypothetical protein C6N75_09940 [Streptomyces solincola]|uniref:Uncharacterized protein n=1 Tax=Streptomyces solincola TaxID=2100817 RepID=A0A2S9PY96_9ACTN|nr:hypothetical protein [Streptomyces solincola]PRH79394.1 hypothetical protein C6N75_09940 [Streptomyces solincola]
MAMQVGNGLDLQNQRIQNLADPSAATDAVTKQYADALSRNLAWKMAVRVATTTSGTLSSAFANGQTVDGVTLATGDRILIKDQSSGAENGIYTVNASGAPTRAVDADSADELKGATVTVLEGTVNADRVFRLITDNVTLNTTALSWTQLGGAGQTYSAGDGLSESPAGTFNVATGTGLEINSDAVRIAAGAAGAGLTGGGGSALAVGAGSGITVNADDVALASSTAGAGLTFTTGVLAVGAGSGISVTADAVAVDATVVRQYATSIGDGSATSYVVTHGLGTRDVQVTVRETASPYAEIMTDNEATSTTTVTIRFASAPTSNQYRVIVQGAA